MRRLLIGCSALLLAVFALGSAGANACDGYCGCGYGYGYGAYYAPPVYFVRPAFAYYSPPLYGRSWGYGPSWRGVGWRAAGWRGVGWRGVGWRGVGWRAAGWRGAGWRGGGWRGGRRW
jgi:hypothetical protein